MTLKRFILPKVIERDHTIAQFSKHLTRMCYTGIIGTDVQENKEWTYPLLIYIITRTTETSDPPIHHLFNSWGQ
jgi:hypothetical protein